MKTKTNLEKSQSRSPSRKREISSDQNSAAKTSHSQARPGIEGLSRTSSSSSKGTASLGPRQKSYFPSYGQGKEEGRSRLEGLAPELTQRIASMLPPADRRTLASTSKQMRHQIYRQAHDAFLCNLKSSNPWQESFGIFSSALATAESPREQNVAVAAFHRFLRHGPSTVQDLADAVNFCAVQPQFAVDTWYPRPGGRRHVMSQLVALFRPKSVTTESESEVQQAKQDMFAKVESQICEMKDLPTRIDMLGNHIEATYYITDDEKERGTLALKTAKRLLEIPPQERAALTEHLDSALGELKAMIGAFDDEVLADDMLKEYRALERSLSETL